MATTTLQQVNVRLDGELKRGAEGVMAFVGVSATEAIRALYTKIGRGAADCVEAMRVLAPDDEPGLRDDAALRQGWSIADGFYRSLGCEASEMHSECRPWSEVYADAMSEHFSEKGLLS